MRTSRYFLAKKLINLSICLSFLISPYCLVTLPQVYAADILNKSVTITHGQDTISRTSDEFVEVYEYSNEMITTRNEIERNSGVLLEETTEEISQEIEDCENTPYESVDAEESMDVYVVSEDYYYDYLGEECYEEEFVVTMDNPWESDYDGDGVNDIFDYDPLNPSVTTGEEYISSDVSPVNDYDNSSESETFFDENSDVYYEETPSVESAEQENFEDIAEFDENEDLYNEIPGNPDDVPVPDYDIVDAENYEADEFTAEEVTSPDDSDGNGIPDVDESEETLPLDPENIETIDVTSIAMTDVSVGEDGSVLTEFEDGSSLTYLPEEMDYSLIDGGEAGFTTVYESWDGKIMDFDQFGRPIYGINQIGDEIFFDYELGCHVTILLHDGTFKNIEIPIDPSINVGDVNLNQNTLESEEITI